MAPNGAIQLAVAAEALVDAQPGDLGAPVHVLVRLPHVLAAAAEAEGPEAHRLQRDVAGEDQQVGPGDLLAVLLLDRPQQAARLVDVDVVGPAVERREALLAATAAAAAVVDAVGAGGVPGHADELRAVVAEVGRPPVLRVGHQLDQVLLQRLVVEALEFLRVVEVLAHRVGLRGMLVQQIQPQLVRPPVAVRRADAGDVVERALARALVVSLRVHVSLRSWSATRALHAPSGGPSNRLYVRPSSPRPICTCISPANPSKLRFRSVSTSV